MGCYSNKQSHRWTSGIIPYEIDRDDYPENSNADLTILSAINHWNTNTIITLQPRNSEDDYVVFKQGDTCSSKIGRRGGEQSISCSSSPNFTSIVHEIGHAVGLHHEQTREDRDLFITILEDNIRNDKRHNYTIDADESDPFGSYNYDSLMHYSPGGFAINWTINQTIPNQRSKKRPAIAEFNGELHMVHLGNSSNDIWHSWSTDGVNWSTNVKIPSQKSKATPALEIFGNELHMVHLGNSSNDIWHSWTTDGRNWTNNVKISSQKSKATPALAFFNGELHMLHLGNSSNNLWHSWTNNGRDWSNNVKISGQSSKAPPALAVHNNRLHMVHLGNSSNNIWHSETMDGRNWTDNVVIEGQKSKVSPSIASHNNIMHMMHLGDSKNDLWHSTYNGSNWSINQRDSNQKSKDTPVLGTFGSQLHLVHLGDSSNNIWQSRFDSSIVAFVSPMPTGTNTALDQNDIDTVAFAYNQFRSGRLKATELLDKILADENNLRTLNKVLREHFDENPEEFFQLYAMEWSGQHHHVECNDDIIKLCNMLDASDKIKGETATSETRKYKPASKRKKTVPA